MQIEFKIMKKIILTKNLPKTSVHGPVIIKNIILDIPNQPGIYFMKDRDENILYIGKAKNLNKRLNSYSNTNKLSPRITKMLSETISIDYTITNHEASALLLEANMIKSKKPKYNILLRDDKSYPHILIRKDHEWPQIIKSRGNKNKSV